MDACKTQKDKSTLFVHAACAVLCIRIELFVLILFHKQLITNDLRPIYLLTHVTQKAVHSRSATTDMVASGFNPMNVNKYPYISAIGTTDIIYDKG